MVLKGLAALGLSPVLGRAVAALAERGAVGAEMLEAAEWISGVSMTPEERELALAGVNELVADFERLRQVDLDNAVPPAVAFDPRGPGARCGERAGVSASPAAARGAAGVPLAGDEELAFAGLAELGAALRSGRVSSLELTRLALGRLGRFDPLLHCVITRTDELALEQAERADRELAAGRDRGPLHGIPWGAKDLMAVSGYPTTWGAAPYRDQVRPEEATVAARLAAAGAVLVTKTSVGALAWGDVWFGAKTRNPWNPEQGSSGSSAGSASAVAAGLVPFALGTETWGSIVSPATRCGATGLRPTFGRVSRHGVMALSWSMDKIGPLARSVEDCALVFAAIHGADGHDPSAVDRPFPWPFAGDPRELRLGYVPAWFDEDRAAEIEDEEDAAAVREGQALDRATLEALRRLGFALRPLDLASEYPVEALGLILTAEASAAFDELTRGGRDDELVRQEEQAWPNVFRQGQMIPAVEYIRANRIRTLVQRELEEKLAEVDVYVSPSFGGNNLLLTNLTGHPQVVVPNGFRASETPHSITFTGRLDGEAALLAVAAAYQGATDFHRRRPPLERFLAEMASPPGG